MIQQRCCRFQKHQVSRANRNPKLTIQRYEESQDVTNRMQGSIVDVGGGRGQSLEAIHKDWPEMQGRMMLQDLPDVIANTEVRGVPSYIEPMSLSFFEEQPVKGGIQCLIHTAFKAIFIFPEIVRIPPSSRPVLKLHCQSKDG